MSIETTVRKLVVEVVEARDLLPIDGTGSCSPYVTADFQGQRKRTKTVPRSLTPAWNEVLKFDVPSDETGMQLLGNNLEIALYHDKTVGNTRRNGFLGCVKVEPWQFVKSGEEALAHYKLRRKSLLGWLWMHAKGEVGLKMYYQDELIQPPAAVPVDPPLNPPKGEDPPAVDIKKPAGEGDEQPPNVPPPPIQPHESPPKVLVPETRPFAGEEQTENTPAERCEFDLVDKMHYLFVRMVKARGLPTTGEPVVKIAVSGLNAISRPARNFESLFHWEETFAFALETPYSSSIMEVSVWDKEKPDAQAVENLFLGGICFDTSEIPVRDPPDSPLAPQWYRLEGGGARLGDLMLATWIGTQADESFSQATKIDGARSSNARSKVYLSPKLWYLRATVIECQEISTSPPPKNMALQVKAQLGFQVLKTQVSTTSNGSSSWNEDLMFVTPDHQLSENHLTFFLEIPHSKGSATLGVASVPLTAVERRVDDRKVTSRWLSVEDVHPTKRAINAKIHVRLCFDGGYHVMDEGAHWCSDYLPTARQLWKPPIGMIELGIIGCKNLLPTKGSMDAYVVAKYGPKWARTRTVTDSLDPTWNEEYTWKVYDPCTVITVGVFGSCDGLEKIESSGEESIPARDFRVGKIRIRISTLLHGKVYRDAYPLWMLTPTGLRKMGDVIVAVRFVQTVQTLDLLHVYTQPLLPLMHHRNPLSGVEQERLRAAAARILADHLAQSEPPIKREVVLYMLDASSHFSMRRIRANWRRVVVLISGVVETVRSMADTRMWKNPTATIFVHVLWVMLVWFPDLIIPTLAFYLFAIGAWNHRLRPRELHPHVCPKLSLADNVDPDELDEEHDVVPSRRSADVVRARYDKLRTLAGRVQTAVGDLAAQGERVQALVSWIDPRATGLFITLCFVVAVILYLVPPKMLAMPFGFYYLRHPMFRGRTPSPIHNFFRRLPSLSDRMM